MAVMFSVANKPGPWWQYVQDSGIFSTRPFTIFGEAKVRFTTKGDTLYRDGKGVARNYAEALTWFRKAAEKNDPAALDNLGWMYEHGLGTAADFPAAAKYYQASADKGHLQGEWNLGRMYAETPWGHYDNAEAARRYRQTAERGHREAQYRLGLAYLQGMGIPADDAQACEWFRKSADQGNIAAAMALGTMYCLGRGVAQSEEQARSWFAKAFAQTIAAQRTPWSGSICARNPQSLAGLPASRSRIFARDGKCAEWRRQPWRPRSTEKRTTSTR